MLLIWYTTTGYGQTSYFITTADGLNTNNLTSIIRDKKDYCWIGSYNGLYRHEGSRIHAYNHNTVDSASLSGGEMHAMFEDREGFIWVGTTAGLDKLNPQTGKVIHYKLQQPHTSSPFIGYIYNITQDKDDNIWVTTAVGFFVLHSQTGRYRFLDGTNGNRAIELNYDINPGGSLVTPAGLWFNTSNIGMLFYEYASGQFFSRYHNPGRLKIFEIGVGNNSDIHQDAQNNIYFITSDSFLVRYNLVSGDIAQFLFAYPKNAWRCCQSISEDKKGNIWIGFRNGGLMVFDIKSHQFNPIRHSSNNKLLPGDYVFDIVKDYQGDMWVTTDDGASIIDTDEAMAKEIYLSDEPEVRNMRMESSIMSVDSKGNIYIPFFGKRLFVYNTGKGEMDSFIKPTGVGGLYVLPGHHNKTYLATDNEGLQELRLSHGKATTMAGPQNELTSSIANKAGNIVWAHGLKNGNYLVKNLDDQLFYFRQGGTVMTFNNPGFMKQSFVSVDEQRLWYIGHDYELIRFDIGTLKSDTISLQQLLKPSGFLISNPRDLLEDAQGNVWITSQNGLLCYDPSANKLQAFTIADGLSHGFTFALNTDHEDRLWVASLGGIDYFDRQKKIFHTVYNSPNGKYMESFGSSVKTPDGDLYFLFGNRLVRIMGNKLQPGHSSSYRFYWNDIQVNGISIPASTSHPAEILRFTHEQNRFEFKFGLLNFKKSTQNLYSYYLEGLDSSWIDIGDRSTLLFNAVPPGRYTLHVKTTSLSFPGKEYKIEFPFIIEKPFWKGGWFIGIIFLFLAVLLYAFVRWRERNIKVINEEKIKVQQLQAEQYKKELELEQIINYFSSSLIDKNTVDEVLWDVAKNLIGRLGFEDCMMYLWNSDKTRMVQRAGYGPKDSIEDIEKLYFDVGPGQGLVGYVMQTKEPVLVPDTSRDPRYRVDDIERLSEITVPIIYNDELVGVIDSEHHERNFFTKQHLQVLSTIATLVGNKIRSIEYEQSLQQARIEMLSINEKLSEAKLEALRSQMNPHFIFNSLNAIQECILTGKVDAAYTYLSQFSRLQRMVLQNSEKEFITLGSEMEMLKLYLSLESLRFSQSFSYSCELQELTDTDEIMVPSMLLQPYVENAIWHGLRNKEGNKILTIAGREEDGDLIVVIEDNGVGRARAAEIKAQKLGAEAVESKGIALSSQRMEILSLKYNASISVQTIDITGDDDEPLGTRVIIRLPAGMMAVKL